MFQDKTILITGGTGSWGNELTKQLLQFQPREIRIFSRGELNQVKMQRNLQSDRLSFYIGDVRDYQALCDALSGVDFVFHLAALKHVPVCEVQPIEAIRTNITGTEHLIRASIEQDVEKVIDISTDKAVDPVNLYGMTKAIGEHLILQANHKGAKTKFICIRGGNVLGTNGSVVPYFLQQIQEKGRVTLTDSRMTRFFLTLQEAIGLLFKAAKAGIGGETFVMKMPACRILDLAEVMLQAKKKPKTNFIETGIRPGEKLHEILISEYESQYTYPFDDNYYVLIGTHPSQDLLRKYANVPRVSFPGYRSSDKLMNQEEIHEMLTKGGFLP